MVRINCRFGRNVFGGILLFAIFSCTLFCGAAFSEEATAEAMESVAEAGRTCALGGDGAGADAALSQLYSQYPTQPQVVPAIERVAQTFFSNNNIAKAQAIYSDAITKISADHPYAVWLHKRVILCQIAQGNITEADESIEAFKNDFSGKPQFSIVLLGIADDCLTHNKYDKAKDLWQYVSQNASDASLAIKAKSAIILCEIRLGNDTAADQVITALMNDHSEAPELCNSLLVLAKKYDRLKKFDKSKVLCQYVAQNSTDSNQVLTGKTYAACMDIKSGNDSAADQAITALMNDHSDSPGLCNSILVLAKDFEQLRKYDKAKALYQYISQNSTDSSLAIKGRTKVGYYEIRAGNDSAVEQVMSSLMNDYSGSPELYDSFLTLAKYYEKLGNSDKARSFCQYVVQNGSDANLTVNTQTWAASFEIRSRNYTVADQAIEKLKTDYFGHPQLGDNLTYLANLYKRVDRFDKARDIFQYVSQNSSDSDLALRSRARAIICQIKFGDNTAAEEAFDTLWANYSSAEGFMDRVVSICNIFIRKNDPALALPYINRALQASTDNEKTKQLLKVKAECYASMGADEQANAVISEIAQTDATDEEYFGTLMKTAHRYQEQGHYDKSIELYQRVIDTEIDKDQQFLAHVGIGMTCFQMEDDPNVTATVDLLCTDFAGHKRLGWGLFVIGEEYFFAAFPDGYKMVNEEQAKALEKCLVIWKRIIDNPCDVKHTQEAYYFSALGYRYLGQYAKAIEYKKHFIENWPKHRFAHLARYKIGEYASISLRKGGDVPVEEAKQSIEQALKGYAEQYPDYSLAKFSLRKLSEFYLRESRIDDAIDSYEKLIEKDINQLKYVHRGYCRALEIAGRDDTAQEVRSVLAEMQQQEN
jgi:tetratricopeptide (TPR) repeat protein